MDQILNLVFATVVLAFIGWVASQPRVGSWLWIVFGFQLGNVVWQTLRLMKVLP